MSANYESPTEYLLSNLDNKILTITLNRPDALNAFRPEMIDGLIELVSKANGLYLHQFKWTKENL